MNKLDTVKDSLLFNGLTPDEITALSGVFVEKQIPAGKTVFVENMPGESLYLVLEGTIKVSKMLAEGDEKILVVLGPEDFFGEMAIFEGAPRSATARVAEDALLLSMKRTDFETLCDSNPRLALKLMRNIIRTFSRRLRENNEEYREMLVWAVADTEI